MIVVVVVERMRRNVHLLVELRLKLVASRPATVTTNRQMQQSNRNPMGLAVGFGCHGLARMTLTEWCKPLLQDSLHVFMMLYIYFKKNIVQKCFSNVSKMAHFDIIITLKKHYYDI